MTDKPLMKDSLSRPAIYRIASSLKIITPNFQAKGFQKVATNGIDELELKARVKHIIEALNRYLPAQFTDAAKILQAIPHHWDHGRTDDPLAGFAAWPLIDYVSHYGLDHPRESLKTLEALTPLFSAEFAIRPFIKQHYKLTYQQLKKWSKSHNEHVRRLVSEGTRPRLPWGERLSQFIEDPSPILPLLEILRDDPSEYVRRSVANNLNDISKDNPDTVISLCQQWKNNESQHRKKLLRHATRSLVKSGNPAVFELLDYSKNPRLKLSQLLLTKQNIQIGETLEFSATLKNLSTTTQHVVIDYAIHFMKANGRQNKKVFKLKNVSLENNKSINIDKKHSFKHITTRSYYPGTHLLELLVNGKAIGTIEFHLH